VQGKRSKTGRWGCRRRAPRAAALSRRAHARAHAADVAIVEGRAVVHRLGSDIIIAVVGSPDEVRVGCARVFASAP
jgi:hypothetical protein